jgi:hypothetical protein
MVSSVPPLAWLLWVVSACVCAHYAKKRGRHPFGWLLIGFLFPLPGLVILFILPKKTPKPLQKQEAAPPAPEPIALQPPEGFHPFWYYLDPNNQQFGPMSFNALEKAWNEGMVTPNTYIWNEAMENWKAFGEVIPQPNK